jgi:hypothetical protein
VIQLPHQNGKWINRPWWTWVWAINIFLIGATVFLTYYPSVPILHYFNLGGELNIAAWWSGILLLVAALVGYERFIQTRDFTKLAWLLISCILLALSWDEVGSLHERILRISWLDYVPYAIGGMVLLGFAFTQLFFKQTTQKAALLLLLGFALFASVAVQEYFEHAIHWPVWSWGIRAAIEEGSELLGIFYCLSGLVFNHSGVPQDKSLLGVLPNPRLMKLSIVVLSCFAIHGASCVWLPYLSDIPNRGNPALWYPAALYFLLFADAIHQYESHRKAQNIWLPLSILWLASSVIVVCYKYPWESLTRFWILHTVLLGFVTFFYGKVFHWQVSANILLLCSLPLVIFFSFLIGGITFVSLMAGIFSYTVAQLFLFLPARRMHKL